MNKKQLISKLKNIPDNTEIIIPAYNGYLNTYTLLDHIFIDNFTNSIFNDLYGTPGVIDERLLDLKENDNIVVLSSEFPFKHTFGDNDINYNIQELNDDPDFIWKQNNFIEDNTLFYKKWTYIDIENNEQIYYYKQNNDYICELFKNKNKIILYNPGIQDLIDSLKLLKFKKQIFI